MDESTLEQQIQLEGARFRVQLMRNNSGAFKDATGRFVWYGLGNVSKKHSANIKSSDLVGFTQVQITPDMVGQTVAIFTAIEVKRPGWRMSMTDKRERAQKAFIDWINANGGRAGFATSLEEFRKIIGV